MNDLRPTFWSTDGKSIISSDNDTSSKKTEADLIINNEVYRQKELEEKIKAILLAIESSDYQKAILLDEYLRLSSLWKSEFDFEKFPDVLKPTPDMFETNLIDYDEQTTFIELKMNFILPYYSKNVTNRTTYYASLKKTYQQPIIEQLSKISSVLDFKDDKCFVLVSQYFTNYIIRDLDNRAHSLIFNALRAANIINDDDWKHLSYMENGHRTFSDKPFTNVLIGYEKDYVKMVNYNNALS